jgi:hypothetical protein
MALMNFIPASISMKGPLSIPVGLVKDTERRMDTNTYTIGLKMLCTAQNLDFLNQVGVWMGNMGTLKREGEGWMMKPKPIPKQTLSVWYNGKEKMPVWRLAQAVVLLESTHVMLKAEAEAAQLPKNDMTWMHLDISKQWLARFFQKEELTPWLDLLRHAVYERLERDSARSPAAKRFFHHYANWLEECRAQAKEHV